AVRAHTGRPVPDRGGHAPWTGRLRFERELRLSAQAYEPPSTPLPVVFYAAAASMRSKAGRRWGTALPGLDVVRLRGRHTGRRSYLPRGRVGPVAADINRRLGPPSR